MAKEKISKLENRVLKCFGSINLKDLSCEDIEGFTIIVENVLRGYAPTKDYFFIWHDETETLHIHFLILLIKQVRLSTIINYLADGLKISPLAINIDNCRGVSLCLRYMIHQDESSKLEGKKQYSINDFISNRDSEFVNLLIQEDDDDEITAEGLIKAVLRYRNKTDILMKLGIKTYHKYRSEIKDLLEDYLHLANQYGYLIKDVE